MNDKEQPAQPKVFEDSTDAGISALRESIAEVTNVGYQHIDPNAPLQTHVTSEPEMQALVQTYLRKTTNGDGTFEGFAHEIVPIDSTLAEAVAILDELGTTANETVDDDPDEDD